MGLGYTNGWLPDMEPDPRDVPLDALINDNGGGLADLASRLTIRSFYVTHTMRCTTN